MPAGLVKDVTIPLVVGGGMWKDSVFNTAVEKCMQTTAQNVRAVVVENCGHFVAEEQPEALIQHLLSFLGKAST